MGSALCSIRIARSEGRTNRSNTTASEENHDRRMAKFLIYLRASIDEPETTGEETADVTEEDSIKIHNKEKRYTRPVKRQAI